MKLFIYLALTISLVFNAFHPIDVYANYFDSDYFNSNYFNSDASNFFSLGESLNLTELTEIGEDLGLSVEDMTSSETDLLLQLLSDYMSLNSNEIPSIEEVTSGITATKTSSEIFLNSRKVSFPGYNIYGNNYFKLRDIATAINNTNKQFNIYWEDETSSIHITKRTPYINNNTAHLESVYSGALNVVESRANVYVEGVKVNISSYNINGSTYYKLRDLANIIGFNVSWVSKNNIILMNTN